VPLMFDYWRNKINNEEVWFHRRKNGKAKSIS
jgi:hypothetical protein